MSVRGKVKSRINILSPTVFVEHIGTTSPSTDQVAFHFAQCLHVEKLKSDFGLFFCLSLASHETYSSFKYEEKY